VHPESAGRRARGERPEAKPAPVAVAPPALAGRARHSRAPPRSPGQAAVMSPARGMARWPALGGGPEARAVARVPALPRKVPAGSTDPWLRGANARLAEPTSCCCSAGAHFFPALGALRVAAGCRFSAW